MQHETDANALAPIQPIADSIGNAHGTLNRIQRIVGKLSGLLSGPVPVGVVGDGPSRGLVGDTADLMKRLHGLEGDLERIASAVGVSGLDEVPEEAAVSGRKGF